MGLRTRQEEEDEPVHDQNRPEDGHVENLPPTAEEGDEDGAGGPIPELELGKTTDEGAELLVLLGGENANTPVLHLIVKRLIGRVEFGLQEGQEEVEKIDAECVCDNVPALRDKDADEEDDEADTGSDPSVKHKWR